MHPNCSYIPYSHTGAFSKLVIDYLDGSAALKPFMAHEPDMEGIKASIAARRAFPTDRQLLVEELRQQYSGMELHPLQAQHLDKLLLPDTFTVTTAHQPNIFTGHLYFIYKILHAIRLCQHLQEQMPDCHFVPVYYMGSEDADLDELGHINVNGEQLNWETDQQGAVGRMRTKGLDKIIERLRGEFGHLPFGEEMIGLCTKAYLQHNDVQTATLYLVNELFRSYGLITLIPDNARLKKAFNEVVKKELVEQFSHPLVAATINELGAHYKVQAAGREINLFYLDDDGRRNRIERKDDGYVVVDTSRTFTQPEILQEVDAHPERFSANVILRGVFQEMILPNIALIGGGGELAYWLELKRVFNAVQVPFPVLLLRNSFLLIGSKEQQLMHKLGIEVPQLFMPLLELERWMTTKLTTDRLQLQDELQELGRTYGKVQTLATAIDPTLHKHVAALHVHAERHLMALEKKMLRAEKRKHQDRLRQLRSLKEALFPKGGLQERVDNLMPLYARHGKQLIERLYQHSLSLEGQFGVVLL